MMRLLVLCLLSMCAMLSHAAINIVATTSSMGMLSRTVGGNLVSVTELAPPDRDIHTLQVKPSMLQALRRAQLVVSVGAELEQGWLPPAISGAANPKILPNTLGYFEAAAQVPLLEQKTNVDRSEGDVHPLGNPHVQLDPVRMADIAKALAERLAKLDMNNAAIYRQNAQQFKEAVNQQLGQWQQLSRNPTGVMLYHKDANYLMARFNIPVLAYIEPLAGIPPTASHLLGLVQQYRGKKGVILHTVYQGHAGIQQLANQLGWPHHALALDPPTNSQASAYFALISQWLNAVSQP
ncbi:metal ABC transporter substrate-binding protein [Agitococcus lubricus]|uniref:Zinc/manganese transport system substrate-binding protein n=1 Tax=Agitococcus lubricus TaxID=1077255 RepID=A0A2T5J3L8_9GAMM|nr:zinc ABC transporter substrate-binding protein [Agitococcus lubricus]PTQ91192.1 zinc/manganese transport system substrate-binding protein [Agitococcus lubricus]